MKHKCKFDFRVRVILSLDQRLIKMVIDHNGDVDHHDNQCVCVGATVLWDRRTATSSDQISSLFSMVTLIIITIMVINVCCIIRVAV